MFILQPFEFHHCISLGLCAVFVCGISNFPCFCYPLCHTLWQTTN